MNRNEYNNLVEHLANEILDGAMEKTAGAKWDKIQEKLNNAKGGVKKGIDSAKAGATKGMNSAKAGVEKGMNSAKAGVTKGINKVKGAPAAVAGMSTRNKALAGAGAAVGLGGAAFGAYKLKKKQNEVAEKAAYVLEDAQMRKIAAEEVYEEALAAEEAVLVALQEAGIDPEEFVEALAEEGYFDGEGEDEDEGQDEGEE